MDCVRILAQKGTADAREKMSGVVRSQQNRIEREPTGRAKSPSANPTRDSRQTGNAVSRASGLTRSADRGRSALEPRGSHFINGTLRPSGHTAPTYTLPLKTNIQTSNNFFASVTFLSRKTRNHTPCSHSVLPKFLSPLRQAH